MYLDGLCHGSSVVERSPKSLGLSTAMWIEKLGEFGETFLILKNNPEPSQEEIKRCFLEGVETSE